MTEDNKGNHVISYTIPVLANDKSSKYVRMHKEDIDHIIHWLTRFSSDINQLSIAFDYLFDPWFKDSKEVPESNLFHHTDDHKRKAPNSDMSYIGGLISNYWRNNGKQDFTKSQLKYIQKLFNTIAELYNSKVVQKGLYNEIDIFELGFDNQTNVPNPAPKPIIFSLV
tara:strand:- start:178 stop:681 length:504 start_codon:yes stop_codon:yes gene_type:complete